MDSRDPATPEGAIAIIGMAGRFPKASNLAEYWANLREGAEAITFFTRDELVQAGVDPELVSSPDYVPARSFMEGAELFDAAFFDFNPREAEVLDPQHRVFLECAFHALEDASYAGRAGQESIGVFAGAGAFDSYLLSNLYANPEVFRQLGAYQIFLGNSSDFLSTRVSYKLDLKGPSTTVQTACSTSLVAVHMACQSLLGYQCDIALAGGVRVTYPQRRGYLYQEGMILSPDGHSRPFDRQAQGLVPGEGVGTVVLKRLDEALEDGDHIRAVIRGSCLNNDGSNKVGYSAPGLDGQVEAVLAAQAAADVHPADISYVEANGTATPLGDVIEVRALTTAFRSRTDKIGYCAIGSVKSNIGHAETAAGVAGLIKTVLALESEEIPASLHYAEPNPEAELEQSPFFVNDRLRPWRRGDRPRLAGVSSFGLGGANVHMIVEEAPERVRAPSTRPHRLLCTSARTPTALDHQTSRLADAIRGMSNDAFADATYTGHVGRRGFEYRRFTVAQTAADAADAMESVDPERVFDGHPQSPTRPVVFMFGGDGSQFPGMGEALYRTEPRYRKCVDDCHAILAGDRGLDLRAILFPEEITQKTREELGRPSRALPALFATQFAMASLLTAWGIDPQAMLGHGVGDYVAACLAEVMALEDAVLLASRRGELLETLSDGATLEIPLAANEVRPLLGDGLSLAAVNSPTQCVASGPREAVEDLRNRLQSGGVGSMGNSSPVAAQSMLVDPILAPFRDVVEQISLRPPERQFFSSLSGRRITPEEATDPDYWVRHLRETLMLSTAIETLLGDQNLILVEVGPGTALSSLARDYPNKAPAPLVLDTMRQQHDDGDDCATALDCLGRIWLTGAAIDWKGFYAHETRLRRPLPPYPFERERYLIEPGERLAEEDGATDIRKLPDLATWFHVPIWKQTPLPKRSAEELGGGWLILHDGVDLAGEIADRLREMEQDVVSAVTGTSFARHGDSSFTLDPCRREDHASLLSTLAAEGRAPRRILHLLNVPRLPDVESAKDAAFFSLLALAQALTAQGRSERVDLLVVSAGLHFPDAMGRVQPEKALLLGPTRVIPLELPFISCRNVEVRPPGAGTRARARVLDELISEALSDPADPVVAYCGSRRLVQDYEPVRVEMDAPPRIALRDEGVYLIAGGMGGIGRTLALHLARHAKVRLALLGRTKRAHSHEELRGELARLGAEVLFLEADISAPEEMAEAVRAIRQRFGPIHGVIHAAGLMRNGTIELRESVEAEKVFAPKLDGTLVLDRALASDPLDFFVLCSDAGAATGAAAQIDYVAANAFQNAFAAAKTAEDGVFTLAIGWGTWSEVGLAARAGRSSGKSDEGRPPLRVQALATHGGAAPELADRDVREAGAAPLGLPHPETAALESARGHALATALREGILPEEGAEAFARVLARGLCPEVLVVPIGLPSLRELVLPVESDFAGRAGGAAGAAASLHGRPELATAFVAPRDELERELSEIWQELLGLERVGAQDDFFELGGHSLLLIQVLTHMRSRVGVRLAMREVIENPTIEKIAKRIREKHARKAEPPSAAGPKLKRVSRKTYRANRDTD